MSLESGFFNAYKNEETGEFDRTYTEENMTDYLRGTIRQNGVFSNVGNRLNVEPVAEQFEVNVRDGKALVNGHWLINNGLYNLQLEAADMALYRRDIVVAEWSSIDRVVRIRIDTGTRENLRLAALRNGQVNFPDTPPIGYVGPTGANRTASPTAGQDMFAPEETIAPIGEHVGDTDYMVQIYLAYIDIPPMSNTIDSTVNDPQWKPVTGGSARIDTATVKGSWYCPWITSMVLDPAEYKEFDFDAFVAMYKQAIVDWFNEVKEDLSIDLSLGYYHKTVDGGAASDKISKSIRLEGTGMEGYQYEPGDIIQVYYNGLLLNENNNEYSRTFDGSAGIITLNISGSYILAPNSVDITIFKGTPLSLPTGDNWIY